MFNTKKLEIRRQNNIILTLIKIWLFLFIIIWLFLFNSYSNFKTNILIKKEISFEIKKWETYKDLSNILNINYNYLKLYLKNNASEFELIAWNFKIEKNSDINEILESLEKPIISGEISITILEWWNIFDIDKFLTNKNLISKGKYIEYTTNIEKIEKLTEFFSFIKWLTTLEWFLYPDTYSIVSENFKLNKFVIKQLENFEDKVYNKLLTNNNIEIVNIINLASIVEKEEKNSEEKATVAWILKKRLNEWWMIWADITVCYPHKLTWEECKMVISKYINEKSEYNTRTMIWLPKTPIWNPSYETINATINSKDTPYYFYLHDTKTGKIYYWKTNSEHEQNKRLYLR